MIKEKVVSAKTIDAAIDEGAAELKVSREKVQYEVLEEPKKGILGIGAANAKVRVYYELTPADLAEDFLKTLFANMNLEVRLERIDVADDEVMFKGYGDNLGILIGRHGDVLDSIQYLTTLAANKNNENFFRVSVDIENYREKRIDSLKQLAKRMADKVLKYSKN
ncbi:MAG: Jag N-terminal domain-containing protein, partial [Eubacteriales bacterium]|nr:Jag N-terminal domain-containing protein [Eubacteriales bacterium]